MSHSVGDFDRLEHDLATAGYAVVRDVESIPRLASLADELDVAYEHAEKSTGGGSISGHLTASRAAVPLSPTTTSSSTASSTPSTRCASVARTT
jgi:hypothetical protein